MPTAENLLIQYESSQTQITYEALTDSGDHMLFNPSGTVISNRSGYSPTIRPNGIVTGSNILTPHASNDTVAYAAFTVYVAGALVSVTAGSVAITRASTSDYVVNAITVDAAGTVAAVKGTEGSSFTGDWGADAGDNPYVDTAKVLVGLVKTTSQTAGVLLATEIFQSAEADQQERAAYPTYSLSYLGDGNQADDANKVNAYLLYTKALPLSHTGGVAKKVYMQYYTPDFTSVALSDTFTEAAETYSGSSKQVYRNTIASESSSLGTGGFVFYPENAIDDALVKLRGERLIFKVYPDENEPEYSLTQGKFSAVPAYPVSDQIAYTVVIVANKKTVHFDA